LTSFSGVIQVGSAGEAKSTFWLGDRDGSNVGVWSEALGVVGGHVTGSGRVSNDGDLDVSEWKSRHFNSNWN